MCIKSRWLKETEDKVILKILANKYSFSAERVHQIEVQVLKGIRDSVEVHIS